jgi:hypothetical protein
MTDIDLSGLTTDQLQAELAKRRQKKIDDFEWIQRCLHGLISQGTENIDFRAFLKRELGSDYDLFWKYPERFIISLGICYTREDERYNNL